MKATAPWESLPVSNERLQYGGARGVPYERIDLSRRPPMSLIGVIFDIWMRVAQRAFDAMTLSDPLAARGAGQD